MSQRTSRPKNELDAVIDSCFEEVTSVRVRKAAHTIYRENGVTDLDPGIHKARAIVETADDNADRAALHVAQIDAKVIHLWPAEDDGAWIWSFNVAFSRARQSHMLLHATQPSIPKTRALKQVVERSQWHVSGCFCHQLHFNSMWALEGINRLWSVHAAEEIHVRGRPPRKVQLVAEKEHHSKLCVDHDPPFVPSSTAIALPHPPHKRGSAGDIDARYVMVSFIGRYLFVVGVIAIHFCITFWDILCGSRPPGE